MFATSSVVALFVLDLTAVVLVLVSRAALVLGRRGREVIGRGGRRALQEHLRTAQVALPGLEHWELRFYIWLHYRRTGPLILALGLEKFPLV